MTHEPAQYRKPAFVNRRIPSPSTVARKATESQSSSANVLRQRAGNQGIQTLIGKISGQCTASNVTRTGVMPHGQPLVRSHPIQPKLTLNQPGDAYEQEADRVADGVMRMPPPVPDMHGTSAVSKAGSAPKVQRRCAECDYELKTQGTQVQRKDQIASAPPLTPSVAASIAAMRGGGGGALPAATRAFFEPRFGKNFSHVRLHTDTRANEAAKSIGARAFTLGRDIGFSTGQYAPESNEGRRLLAHELTHVVQQGAADITGAAPSLVRSSASGVMRSVAVDSTVNICHRELTSRNFKVSHGGVRVVMLLNPLNLEVRDCKDHTYWVTLTKSREWRFDDEIATCEGRTGGTRSFSFGGLPNGTYYLTINRIFDHPYCCIEGDILIFDEPITADSSGCTRDKDLTAMDIVHGALDLAGFIPVLGAIPDGINAAIYVAEGDWTNAGLSAVAMVPAWGDGVKLGVMAEKSVIKISNKAAFKLGEEGIAKGLKEVKAASKAETAAAGTAAKAEREAFEKAEKEAAEKALQRKIAECEAIWASYKALNCPSCKDSDTAAERVAKIACLTALIAGRRQYLKEKCDYVLPGSVARGSAKAEKGHEIQVEQIAKMLLKCSTLPTT